MLCQAYGQLYNRSLDRVVLSLQLLCFTNLQKGWLWSTLPETCQFGFYQSQQPLCWTVGTSFLSLEHAHWAMNGSMFFQMRMLRAKNWYLFFGGVFWWQKCCIFHFCQYHSSVWVIFCEGYRTSLVTLVEIEICAFVSLFINGERYLLWKYVNILIFSHTWLSIQYITSETWRCNIHVVDSNRGGLKFQPSSRPNPEKERSWWEWEGDVRKRGI